MAKKKTKNNYPNKGCSQCDYAPHCKKKVRTEDNKLVLAKEQTLKEMTCLCIGGKACVTGCPLFDKGECAFWMVQYGKKECMGEVVGCAKKANALRYKRK